MGNTEQPHAPAVLSTDDFTRHEITAGLRANEALIHQFAKAWYRSPYTFRSTRVLGYLACKIPFDLWVIQDLMCQYRFSTVIECGTAGGGTTLWYAALMDLLGIDGQVHSIDIDEEEVAGERPTHPRITYHHGNTTDLALVAQLNDLVKARGGTVLINLDSDHHAHHVLRELELWAPVVPVGSWLVVEDTNGAPVETDPATGQPILVEGPYAAVMEYLQKHPGEFIQDVVCQRYWLSMCPGGWMQRLREVDSSL